MSSAEESVRKTLNKYVAASNNGDAEAFAELMLDDVEINPPDHPAVIGPEAAKQWVQREFFDKFDVKLDINPQSFDAFNSAMHVKGKFDLQMTPKDGDEAESVSGAFYNIFREADDGAWKYKYLMFNFD